MSSNNILMGPASQPFLSFDLQDWIARFEARFEDGVVAHKTRFDEPHPGCDFGLGWLQGSVSSTDEGHIVFIDGGEQEDAFILWMRTYLPEEQKLFLHAWYGDPYLEITKDTTPETIHAAYAGTPSGDLHLACHGRIWDTPLDPDASEKEGSYLAEQAAREAGRSTKQSPDAKRPWWKLW